MRVLLLSANTGEGHNSCAKAIKEVFDLKGETCVLEDGLRFISEKTSRFLSWGHVYVYRNLPWLFNFGYGFTERHASSFRENSTLYDFLAKGSNELYKYIVRGTFDTVIAAHPFTAVMLTAMQRKYHLPIKTAFVATDYTCSPSVKDSDLDLYFIPDEKVAHDFLSPYIPKEKMVVSGIPIRQMFYKSTEKNTAKTAFGIPTDHKHMVMMCGSMGCGPIEKLTGILTDKLQDGFTLTVVCGTNEKLKAQLEAKYGGRKNLHIKGFVTDMSLMLDSADLYLTKAGGISVSEAAVKNLPMVYIKAVAGCEDYNSRFFCELGGASSGKDLKKLVDACTCILTDDVKLENMASALLRQNKNNASECIFDTLRSNRQVSTNINENQQ